MGKAAAYIGNFKVGICDAQSQLVIGNSKLLRALGYTVTLIGNDNTLAARQDIRNSRKTIEGFDVYNLSFSKSAKDFLKSRSIHHQIIRILQGLSDLKMVICYGTPSFAPELSFLHSWCRQHNIAFIANCVDIPNQSHGSGMEKCIKKLDRRWREHIYNYKTDGIIAVSSYIARQYVQRKKKPVVILPPLKDSDTLPIIPSTKHPSIEIVYVGVPFPTDGRKVDEEAYKDRIDLFIDLLTSVPDVGKPVHLNLYGLSKEQYLHVVTRHTQLIKDNEDKILFHGRVEHKKAMEAVGQADFSVVYRLPNQMTMAGFSSKLVESISCGTPVLYSDTSDYVNYLQDGKHGFLLNIEDPEKAQKKLAEILRTPFEEIAAMKECCRQSKIFDYRNYMDSLKAFLNQVNGK